MFAYRTNRRCLHAMFRAIVASALLAEAAGAGQAIQWRSDAAAAVTEAREKELPLFIYIPPSRDARREAENWEDAQHRVLGDPVVVAILCERFIPLRAQRSTNNAELFKKLNINPGKGMKGATATADGLRLEELDPACLCHRNQVFSKLTSSYRRFRDRLYDSDLQPILASDAPRAEQLAAALKKVQRHLIVKATPDLVKLLDRALSDSLRRQVYHTLAVLSTPAAVRALLARVDNDRDAASELKSCEKGAVDTIAAAMNDQFDAHHIAAYEAAAAILKRHPKPAAFWRAKGAFANSKKREERDAVIDLARRAAREWNQTFGRFR